jgi:hypothetical protein
MVPDPKRLLNDFSSESSSKLQLFSQLQLFSCRASRILIAWYRTHELNLDNKFVGKSLNDIIDYRNDVAILRSNRNHTRIDLAKASHTASEADISQHSAEFKDCNDLYYHLGLISPAIQNYIMDLDAMITKRQSDVSIIEQLDGEDAEVIEQLDEVEIVEDNPTNRVGDGIAVKKEDPEFVGGRLVWLSAPATQASQMAMGEPRMPPGSEGHWVRDIECVVLQ